MVSMARPFLADAEFVNKAAAGRADEINTCIACNQACLDQIFARQIASCLVNPRACHETEIVAQAAPRAKKRIAVVGAGPAGLACATTAAEARPRGHAVRRRGRNRRPVQPRAAHSGQGGVRRDAALLTAAASSAPASRCSSAAASAPAISRASTTSCSRPASSRARRRFPGIDHPKVAGYADIVAGPQAWPGKRVAIIGAGGIGFDVGEFLTHQGGHDETDEYFARVGHRPAVPRARRPRAGRRAVRRRARSGCCSARRARSATASPRPPAGSAARCSRSAA